MRTSLRSARRAAVVLVLVTGCTASMGGDSGMESTEPVGLRITSPADGELVLTSMVDVTGEIVEGTTPPALITVNGVTATIEGRTFRAENVPLDGEGPQRIEARGGPNAHHRIWVNVDSEGPRIVLESPLPGSYVEGTTVRVAGRVEDRNVERLELDGLPVPIDRDGRFEILRYVDAGAHRFRLRATDTSGRESWAFGSCLAGAFAEPGEPILDAASLGIGTAAIDALEPGGEALLAAQDYEALVLALNPVVSGWWGRIEVLGEDHGAIGLELSPGNSQLSATVTVASIRVPFVIRSSVGANVSGVATVARATLTQALGAEVTAAGRINVFSRGTNVALTDFRVAVDWVPSFIENWDRVRDAIRTRIEAAVEDGVGNALPPYLETALSRVPRSGTFPLMESRVHVDARVADVHLGSGGIGVVVDLSVEGSEHTKDAPGSIVIGHEASSPIAGPGVSVGMALDVLNAAAFAAWDAGTLDRRVDSLPYMDDVLRMSHLTLLVPQLRRAAPAEAPIAVVLSPALQPVIQTTRDGEIEVFAPDVRATLVAVVDGADTPLLTVSLALGAPVELHIERDEIGVRVGAVELTADLVDAPAGAPAGDELDALLRAALGPASASLLDLSGLRAPSVYGYQVTADSFSFDRNFLRFTGTLDRTGS